MPKKKISEAFSYILDQKKRIFFLFMIISLFSRNTLSTTIQLWTLFFLSSKICLTEENYPLQDVNALKYCFIHLGTAFPYSTHLKILLQDI